MLSKEFCETPTEDSIPLTTYLKEGLMILHYIEIVPGLTELFTKKGCEDLLDLSDLVKSRNQKTKGQDTESLLNYLIRQKSQEMSLAEPDWA